MNPHVREPLLEPVPIESLRPTQITVGMREVHEKRRRWREFKGMKKAEFLGRHMIPVIWGPKERHYVLVTVVSDLRALDRESFWVVLDLRGWCHPYDSAGRRRPIDELPKSVSDLEDDPFRSLAGELRRAGGFAKDTTPFSEFLWADFLRRRMKAKQVDRDFDAALVRALELAKSDEAHYLPGWCGPASKP